MDEAWFSDADLRALIAQVRPEITDAQFASITEELLRAGLLERVRGGYSPSRLGVCVMDLGHGKGH